MAAPGDIGSPPAQIEEDIDAEIARAREELKTACARRDVLASALLSTEYIQNLNDDGVSSPFVDRQPLADTLSKHRARTKLQDRRALLTTTLFSTQDPDPCAKDGGNVYSVRIERYSRARQEFLTPAYVFLRRSTRQDGIEGDLWKLHRHTLPACIPIRALGAKYLPDIVANDDGGSKGVPQKHDIQEFIGAVTNEVVSLLRRQEAIEAIRSSAIKGASAVNAEATDVRISWKNQAVTRLRVSSDGAIEKVVAEKGYARDGEQERKILAAEKLEILQDVF